MEKKNYLAPAAKEVNLLTMVMMATSTEIQIDRSKTGSEQLTSERRDGWGDMWN